MELPRPLDGQPYHFWIASYAPGKVELYKEWRGFKIDAQFYDLLNEINKTVELQLPWLFVNVTDHVWHP